jgi:outer membrane protein assembly factor BamB
MSDPRERSQPIAPHVFLLIAWLLLCGIASATPSITLSKKTGPPTSRILVSGRGFESNVGVDIFFDTKDKALVVTDGKGEFDNARVFAPRSASPGKHWVTALERNNDKGAQRPFVVNTNWSGYNYSPDHDGLNPYENVLNPSNLGNLALRWSFSNLPSNLFSPPAVVDGVMYTASVDSNLYAFDARTGTILWKYAFSSSGYIPSPSVFNGVVYVAACDLYALDAKTGKVLWKYTTGACVGTSPVVVNGVVYVGADNFYAVDAATGTLLWKYISSVYIASTPAVADGVVCFGSGEYGQSGAVIALNANTGALLWSFATGTNEFTTVTIGSGVVYFSPDFGPITALDLMTGTLRWSNNLSGDYCCSTAAVAYGRVYFSFANHVYALDPADGHVLWIYMTNGASNEVGNDPVVANGVVYVGSAENNMYALNPRTGALLWQYPVASGAEFLWAVVANGVLYTAGQGVSAFSLSGGASEWTPPADRPVLKNLHPDLTLQLQSLSRRG